MKIAAVVSAALLSFVTQPVLAQDEWASADAAADAMEEQADAMDEYDPVVAVEPLTPEQRERLPAARELVAIAMPESASSSVTARFAGGILALGAEDLSASEVLMERLHYYVAASDITNAKAERALEIIDPEWRERERIALETWRQRYAALLEQMEPVFREALAEIYAERFTASQLVDIAAFYRTETGRVFAQQSLSLASSPRLVAAMTSNSSLWENMYDGNYAIVDGLPEARSFDELSQREREQLMALTGLDEATLRSAIDYDYSDVDEAGGEELIEMEMDW